MPGLQYQRSASTLCAPWTESRGSVGTPREDLAGRIRAYIDKKYIRPARERGEGLVMIRAGDVHQRMGLTSRMPSVCGVLRSRKLEEELGIERVAHCGPHAGANALYEFRVRPEGAAAPAPPAAPPAAPANAPVAAAAAVGPAARESIRELEAETGRVALVSCVASKRAYPVAAKDLYISPWFTKTRAVVEALGVPWFILSAEYGLVHPDTVIAPYERTLNTMSADERRAWASRVLDQLAEAAPRVSRVIFFAGERYREHLAAELAARGVRVEVPMAGLRIGEQLSWLDRQLRHD